MQCEFLATFFLSTHIAPTLHISGKPSFVKLVTSVIQPIVFILSLYGKTRQLGLRPHKYHSHNSRSARKLEAHRPQYTLILSSNYCVFPAQLWSQKCSFRSRCFRSATTELSTIIFHLYLYIISFLLIIIIMIEAN